MKRVLFVGITAMALGACSGSNSQKQPSQTEAQVGYLETVAGLSYRTDTLSGTTSAIGAFEYREGEQITFSLGATDLVTTTAKANFSLFELIDGAYSLPRTAKEVRAQLRMPEYTLVPSELENITMKKAFGTIPNLHQASNIMQLLLALDSDQDANNGIDLTQGQWQEALMKLTVNFKQPLDQFSQSEVMDAFQHETGISLAMDKAAPLKALYQLGDIKVNAKVNSHVLLDTSSRSTSYDFAYSESGLLTQEIRTSSSRQVSDFEYDEFGNQIKHTSRIDSDRSGSYDVGSIKEQKWNAFGRRTEIKHTRYSDDLETADFSSESKFTYQNDRVRFIERTHQNDNDADGTMDQFNHYSQQYNEDGQIIDYSHYIVDSDGEVIRPFTLKTQSYDVDGRTTRHTEQSIYQVNPEVRRDADYTFTYDENTITQTSVKNGVTSILTQTYDEGRLIQKEYTELDADNQITSYATAPITYDEMGRITSCTINYRVNPEQPVEETYKTTIVYDENGINQIAYQSQGDDIPSIEFSSSAEYGEEGELTVYLQNNAMATDRTHTFSYSEIANEDALGYLIHEVSRSIMPRLIGRGTCSVAEGFYR